MPNKPSASIEFRSDGIRCTFDAFYTKEENDEFSWHIPAFRMFFSSKTYKEGTKTSIEMTKSLFDYWLTKERNFRNLILEINKLGFKANDHRITVNKLLRGKTIRASFKSPLIKIPTDYSKASKEVMDFAV